MPPLLHPVGTLRLELTIHFRCRTSKYARSLRIRCTSACFQKIRRIRYESSFWWKRRMVERQLLRPCLRVTYFFHQELHCFNFSIMANYENIFLYLLREVCPINGSVILLQVVPQLCMDLPLPEILPPLFSIRKIGYTTLLSVIHTYRIEVILNPPVL